MSANISFKKCLTTKQAKYVYSNCKNEVIGSEQVYECEQDDKPQVDSQLNPYEYAMLNDFVLNNVHAECAENEKWSILDNKIDYVEYSRKELLSNRVKFSSTE